MQKSKTDEINSICTHPNLVEVVWCGDSEETSLAYLTNDCDPDGFTPDARAIIDGISDLFPKRPYRNEAKFGGSGSRHEKSFPSDPSYAFLNREDSARLLRVSLRQLDRLPIPRSYALGPRSPRYALADLIAFMQLGVRVCERPSAPSASKAIVKSKARASADADWLKSRLSSLK